MKKIVPVKNMNPVKKDFYATYNYYCIMDREKTIPQPYFIVRNVEI